MQVGVKLNILTLPRLPLYIFGSCILVLILVGLYERYQQQDKLLLSDQ